MPIDILVGIGLAKGSLELIKAVREAAKKNKLTNEEFLDYLSTLKDKLDDVKTALYDADEENRALKRKVEELEAEVKKKEFLKENFIFRGNMIWPKERKVGDGPYCPTCFETGILSRLLDYGQETFFCINHKQAYRTPSSERNQY